MPAIPSNSGAGFYRPGAIESEYEKVHNQPNLPGVAPPQDTEQGAASAAAAFASVVPIDPNAPDILDLIKGGKFDPPFTVTLRKRQGMQVFKSDAGTKTEANFELWKETIRVPADLLRISAGVKAEVYQPLNNMTLEFQLMLYLAYKNRALDVPPPPAPQITTQVSVQAETEESTV